MFESFCAMTNNSSRRDFLKLLSTVMAAAAGGSASLFTSCPALAQWADPKKIVPNGREYLLMGDTSLPVPKGGDYTSVPGTINIYDVVTGETSSIEVPFFGHVVNQSKTVSEHVVAFQKWGTLGALIDIKKKAVIELIPARKGSTFFGHSAFCGDGKILVCTEELLHQESGSLVLRDFPSMKIIGELPSYGGHPHECRSLADGQTIVVANNFGTNHGAGSLSWVDVHSGKLLNKIELRPDSVEPSHFDFSFDGWMCVVGKSLEKHNITRLVAFVSPSGEVHEPQLPDNINKKVKDEVLSIAFLGNTGLVALTIPAANMLLVMDYKTQTLVEVFSLAAPKGVLMDLDPAHGEASIIASLSNDRKLVSIVHSDHNPPILVPEYAGFGGNGSHMSRIYI